MQGQNSRLPTPSFWSQIIGRGREEIGLSVSALSAGAYTATLYVMVDIVNENGRAPLTLTSQG
jgi:hypothetical protein